MSRIDEVFRFLAIICMCVVAAIGYGILHDQITARICVEYFTIGHPPIFNTDSPTLLGIGWGIVATWWVGVILGFPLAIAARLGDRPKLAASDLLRPMFVLLCLMASLALLAGFVSNRFAQGGSLQLNGPLGVRVPADRHVAFLTDACAHSMSYFAGFVGGMVVVFQTWWRRRMLAGQLARQRTRQFAERR